MADIINKHPKFFSILITIIIFTIIIWYQHRYKPKNNKNKKDKKKYNENNYSQYIYPGIVSICIGVVVYLFITINNKNTMIGGGDDSDYETDTSMSVRRYLTSIRNYGKEINSEHFNDNEDMNIPNEPIIESRHNNNLDNFPKMKILSSGIKIPINIDDNILSI